jgi:glycopeptide antibiotics resistance protein
MLVFLPFLFLFRQVYKPVIFLSVILGCLFAAFAEYIQYLLPYRAFNINDLLGNVFGILTGLILLIPAINASLSRFVLFRKIK